MSQGAVVQNGILMVGEHAGRKCQGAWPLDKAARLIRQDRQAAALRRQRLRLVPLPAWIKSARQLWVRGRAMLGRIAHLAMLRRERRYG